MPFVPITAVLYPALDKIASKIYEVEVFPLVPTIEIIFNLSTQLS